MKALACLNMISPGLVDGNDDVGMLCVGGDDGGGDDGDKVEMMWW